MKKGNMRKLEENLFKSKQQICDWIMNMSVKDYYEFMSILTEGKSILEDIDNIPLEAFYTCTQCKDEHAEDCETGDAISTCYKFFCEHYGIEGKESEVN